MRNYYFLHKNRKKYYFTQNISLDIIFKKQTSNYTTEYFRCL